MRKLFVFSTLACDVTYSHYAPRDNKSDSLPHLLRGVTIKGGAGVANSRLITPRGVMTEITEEDEAILRQDRVFLLHEQNGFVTVEDSQGDADKVAEDMNEADLSRPITPENSSLDSETVNDGKVTRSDKKKGR